MPTLGFEPPVYSFAGFRIQLEPGEMFIFQSGGGGDKIIRIQYKDVFRVSCGTRTDSATIVIGLVAGLFIFSFPFIISAVTGSVIAFGVTSLFAIFAVVVVIGIARKSVLVINSLGFEKRLVACFWRKASRDNCLEAILYKVEQAQSAPPERNSDPIQADWSSQVYLGPQLQPPPQPPPQPYYGPYPPYDQQ